MANKKSKIEEGKWYTLKDILNSGLLPCNTFYSLRKAVLIDKKGKNVLKTVITGDDMRKRYHFRGENIIKFIKEFEAGKVTF